MKNVNHLFSNYGKTYSRDKRKDIRELYRSFLSLSSPWIIEVIDNHTIKERKKELVFPVLSLRTRKKGKAIWVLSGMHGEEPAGPMAVSENMNFFRKLSNQGIPIVIIPLINPSGYYRNWRYLFHWKYWTVGKSMGDCEPFLLNKNNEPRKKKTTAYADKFAKYIFSLTKEYPPEIVLDFHEDEIKTLGGDPFYGLENKSHSKETYIYSQGRFGSEDLIANKVVKIMASFNHAIKSEGILQTRFKEKVVNGIVSGVKDSSIDEFLASKKIFFNNRITKGPYAKTVVVVETLTNVPLGERIKIHSKVIHSIKEFIKLSKKQR